MRPAKYVRAIAFLFIALAAESLLGICVKLLEGQPISLDFAFLLELWIGFNLLEYRDSARKWALALAWYVLVAGSLHLMVTVFEHREMPYFVFGALAGYTPRNWQFVVLGTLVTVSAIVVVVLHLRATRRLFENPPPRAAWKVPTVLRAGAAVTIIAIPVVLVLRSARTKCSDTGRDAIYVDIRDALTNEKIGTGATVAAGQAVSNRGSTMLSESDGPWPAMVSRPGRYVVTVTKDGYRQWVQYRVLVKAKGCELQRVDLTARLQRET